MSHCLLVLTNVYYVFIILPVLLYSIVLKSIDITFNSLNQHVITVYQKWYTILDNYVIYSQETKRGIRVTQYSKLELNSSFT